MSNPRPHKRQKPNLSPAPSLSDKKMADTEQGQLNEGGEETKEEIDLLDQLDVLGFITKNLNNCIKISMIFRMLLFIDGLHDFIDDSSSNREVKIQRYNCLSSQVKKDLQWLLNSFSDPEEDQNSSTGYEKLKIYLANNPISLLPLKDRSKELVKLNTKVKTNLDTPPPPDKCENLIDNYSIVIRYIFTSIENKLYPEPAQALEQVPEQVSASHRFPKRMRKQTNPAPEEDTPPFEPKLDNISTTRLKYYFKILLKLLNIYDYTPQLMSLAKSWTTTTKSVEFMKAVNVRLFKGNHGELQLKNLDSVKLNIYIDAEGKPRSKEYLTQEIVRRSDVAEPPPPSPSLPIVINKTPATIYDAAKTGNIGSIQQTMGQQRPPPQAEYNKIYSIKCGGITLIELMYKPPPDPTEEEDTKMEEEDEEDDGVKVIILKWFHDDDREGWESSNGSLSNAKIQFAIANNSKEEDAFKYLLYKTIGDLGQILYFSNRDRFPMPGLNSPHELKIFHTLDQWCGGLAAIFGNIVICEQHADKTVIEPDAHGREVPTAYFPYKFYVSYNELRVLQSQGALYKGYTPNPGSALGLLFNMLNQSTVELAHKDAFQKGIKHGTAAQNLLRMRLQQPGSAHAHAQAQPALRIRGQQLNQAQLDFLQLEFSNPAGFFTTAQIERLAKLAKLAQKNKDQNGAGGKPKTKKKHRKQKSKRRKTPYKNQRKSNKQRRRRRGSRIRIKKKTIKQR